MTKKAIVKRMFFSLISAALISVAACSPHEKNQKEVVSSEERYERIQKDTIPLIGLVGRDIIGKRELILNEDSLVINHDRLRIVEYSVVAYGRGGKFEMKYTSNLIPAQLKDAIRSTSMLRVIFYDFVIED